jgi:hypothetical protein
LRSTSPIPTSATASRASTTSTNSTSKYPTADPYMGVALNLSSPDRMALGTHTAKELGSSLPNDPPGSKTKDMSTKACSAPSSHLDPCPHRSVSGPSIESTGLPVHIQPARCLHCRDY